MLKKTPTAQQKWVNEGFDVLSWKKVYEIPYNCTASTKLQSLQYRVINRYIPTRKFLATRNVIGSPLCPSCFAIDDLRHFFYDCPNTYTFWIDILRQIKNMLLLPERFVSAQTVLLGYPQTKPVVNLILLLGKQHILNCKVNENIKTPNKINLLQIITSQFKAEKVIAEKHGKIDTFWKKWEKIIDINNTLQIN